MRLSTMRSSSRYPLLLCLAGVSLLVGNLGVWSVRRQVRVVEEQQARQKAEKEKARRDALAQLREEVPAHPPMLSGKHPHHFPLYFEDDARVSYSLTPFEREVLVAWRERHEADGIFNYRVGGPKEPLTTRPLGGKFGMIAQAALGRGTKRSPHRGRLTSVFQPINPDAFNFLKAKGSEVIGRYTAGDFRVVPLELDAKLSLNDQARKVPDRANLIVVNANPMCPFHILLVPEYGMLNPQMLTDSSMRLALSYASHQSRFFRFTFNSFGAGSSINHQHWQGIYLRNGFPIESQPTTLLHGCSAVRLHEVRDWPVRAYILSADTAEELATAAMEVVAVLQEEDIAHNIVITDQGRRVIIVPRSIGYYPDVRKLQVASAEVLGMWVIPNQEEYAALQPEQAEQHLREARPPDTLDVLAIIKGM